MVDKVLHNNVLRDMTEEEIAQKEIDEANAETDRIERANTKEQLDNLKASAKAKLIAGEPLTEEEAETIVL
jgi:hypothetical protein